MQQEPNIVGLPVETVRRVNSRRAALSLNSAASAFRKRLQSLSNAELKNGLYRQFGGNAKFPSRTRVIKFLVFEFKQSARREIEESLEKIEAERFEEENRRRQEHMLGLGIEDVEPEEGP